MKHLGRFFGAVGLISILCYASSVHAVGFELFGTIHRGFSNANTLVTVDPNTGEQTFAGSLGLAQHSRDIDWNPTTGTLFGSDLFDNPGVIQVIDHAGMARPVATIRQGGQLVEIGALAFASDGTLYSVAGRNAPAMLGRIDLATETFVPLLPIPARLSVQGIDISPDGILYAVFANRSPGEFQQTLVAIDLTTLSIIDEKDLLGHPLSVDDIDYAPDGYIYHTNFSFALGRIDPVTGFQTHVGFGDLGALAGIASPPAPAQGCLPSSLMDTCIDFNTLLDGRPTSDTLGAVDGLYSPLGVNFRSKDDAGPTFSHPLHPFSSQSIVINDFSRSQGGTFNIVAEFLTPTNFVSADVLSAAGRSVRMTAKDASGAILGSTTSSSETISAFPFKGNVVLAGIGAISTVEFEAVPDPARAAVAIDDLTFSVVFEAAPASEAPSAPIPIPCQGKSCRVTIFCISADLAVPCNNAITVSVGRPRRSSVSETSGEGSDGRRAKAPLMVPFASGVANIPPRQSASVKLKITKKGRRIAQSRVKKLRGVMSISNIAGSRTLSVPVRIKLK